MHYHLHAATTLTKLLDSQFQIFKWKFGLDPVLGLIPGIGDIIPAVLSFYIVWIAWSYNLPQSKINQMIANIVLDFLIGTIPIIGDAADFFYKASSKNLEILKSHLEEHNIIEGVVLPS